LDSRHFQHLRIDYGDRELRGEELPRDPLELFGVWLADATRAGVSEPNGMALATVDHSGAPSCRIVLLKAFDADGFRFFTHFDSDKGKHLARDPRAALTFWWSAPTARQVRLAGDVHRVADAEADAYFATRPRESQLATAVSPQSQPIGTRAELEARLRTLAEQLGERPVLRPPGWGGYCLRPRSIEFWQGRTHRLHDRFRYSLADGGGWQTQRLAP